MPSNRESRYVPTMINKEGEDVFEKYTFRNENGDILKFRLLKPMHYDKNKSYPLVLFLHGVYQRGADNIRQTEDIEDLFLNPENREKYPCFVIAPQCPLESYWANTERKEGVRVLKISPSSPIVLTLALMEEMIEIYSIDTNRLYITGLSMGSFGTFDVLMRNPDLFAAAIPICGGGITSHAQLITHIPMWIFHGTNDKIIDVEYSRNMVAALKEKNGSPFYTEYPDTGHDSWIKAYSEPELLEWLFAQRKK